MLSRAIRPGSGFAASSVLSPSEWMRGMRAHDEGGLEEVLADLPGAAAIVHEVEIAAALAPGRLLVAQAEAQELRRIVGKERLHGPLRPRIRRVLRPVVAETQLPLRQLAVGEGLKQSPEVEALAVALARLIDAVLVRGHHVTEREEILTEHGDGRVLPAGRRVLVLGIEAHDHAVSLLRCLAVCNRRADLERSPLVEIDEGAHATRHEGIRDLVAAECHRSEERRVGKERRRRWTRRQREKT